MYASLIAVLLIAQYTPRSKPHSYTAGTVLHPGGVPPQTPAGAAVQPMGGYGQPRQQSGGGRGHGVARSGAPHPAHERSAIVPVYFGTYFSEPEQPPPPPAEPPVVIINQAYRPEVLNPVLHDYSNVPLLEAAPLEQRQAEPPRAFSQRPDPSPTIYLIALNDGTIVAALGYWMEGDTLAYITRDANRNRISIDRVDREFSVKLNAGRNLEFKLE